MICMFFWTSFGATNTCEGVAGQNSKMEQLVNKQITIFGYCLQKQTHENET